MEDEKPELLGYAMPTPCGLRIRASFVVVGAIALSLLAFPAWCIVDRLISATVGMVPGPRSPVPGSKSTPAGSLITSKLQQNSETQARQTATPISIQAAQAFAAGVKPGGSESEIRKSVLAWRATDEEFWNDVNVGNLERFALGNGAYLIARYDHPQNPLNISSDDRVSRVYAVTFDELKGRVPPALLGNLKLVFASPQLEGNYFDPVCLMQCVNGLQRLGKAKAISALRAYATLVRFEEDHPDADPEFSGLVTSDPISLIARVLFVPRDIKDQLPDMTWVLFGTKEGPRSVMVDLPLFPLVMCDDIPFNVGRGTLASATTNADDVLDFCEDRCELRAKPLAPAGTALDAADALMCSGAWKRAVNGLDQDCPFTVQALVRTQALRCVGGPLEPAFLEEHDAKRADAMWSAYYRQWNAFRWDLNTQRFLQVIPLPKT